MSHDYHEIAPGYHADQILHDGCGECEARAARDDHGISSLDSNNFRRAVARTIEWNHRGITNISAAERPLLATLWSVYIQLEARGVSLLAGAVA